MTPPRTSGLRSLIPLGIVLLLCAVAVLPLLRADSPCSHDGAFHYYRVAAMRHALRDGILFTRYLPDLALGYGYPFFNYRAALSYYLALALHLAGLALPLALNLVYVLSILGSALGAYLLARDLFGPLGGVVAAVAYAYAPYQFLDALLRANAPESVALPLMPLILWAFRRLALTGQRRWFLVSTGSLVALLLAHNISSLLFMPFLLAYLIVLWLVYRRSGHSRGSHWIAAGTAIALALGLTAFFLGPALLEQGYVQLHMSRVTRNNDFHYNYLPLAEIFALPAPVDTSLMNPPMRVHLGLLQAILGGIGFVVGLVRWWKATADGDRERRTTLVFFGVVAAAMVWMSTRSSLWVWEHVPLIPFIQFPWRLVGRAILPLSVLAAALPMSNTEYAIRNTQYTPGFKSQVSGIRYQVSRFTFHVSRLTLHVSRFTPHVSRITYFASVALLIVAAFPYTYPPHGYCANPGYPTIEDVFAYERRTRRVGVDPEGSYFPAWVEERPEEGSPLEEQYTAGGPVERFDESALPPGASVIEAGYGPNRAQIAIETPAPFRARYLAFYFPGWQVQIDGEPVELIPTDPEGLISFDVPAGRHTIAVRFGSTPTRTTFTAISLLALATLLALTVRYPRIHEPTNPPSPEPENHHPSPIVNWKLFIAHCSLAIVLLALKLAIVDRTDTLFRRPTLEPDGTLPGVAHPLDQPYADGLTLIGYDQAEVSIPADGTLHLDLYWTATARPGARYQTVVHLVGAGGVRWSEPDSFRPRGYAKYPPTDTWTPGRYALDSHEVEPLSGTPPGTYDVVLTAFDRDTLAPLSLLNDQGQPAAPELALGRVTLTHPRRRTEPPAGEGLDLRVGDFTLLTARFDRHQAAPGDTVFLTLIWQAEEEGDEASSGLSSELVLQAPDGADGAIYAIPYPIRTWRAGEVWRSQHYLTLPATLDTGRFTWAMRRKATGGEEEIGAIGQMSVVAPLHTFTAPPVDLEIDTPLGDVATLVGADLEPETWNLEPLPPGSALTATLVWRAEKTPTTSYHVFLHLLDAEGRLVAQSDAVPANWSRPTTGWLPGETITDAHTLTIPPDAAAGDYTLATGLYIPNGERVTTADGSDNIYVATITVEPQ
jgi:hypothetical protein